MYKKAYEIKNKQYNDLYNKEKEEKKNLKVELKAELKAEMEVEFKAKMKDFREFVENAVKQSPKSNNNTPNTDESITGESRKDETIKIGNSNPKPSFFKDDESKTVEETNEKQTTTNPKLKK